MATEAGQVPRDGRELMEAFLPQSPFVIKLGVRADSLEPDRVVLRMPWSPANVTVGDMVHGGAISALVDMTAMAAAWSGAALPSSLRGVTTSMAIEFLAPARETDLLGRGSVLRRGRSLVNCDVDIVHPDGELVAKAIATYKIG
jgi:uncharacterized protein (TIGR00369 family)